jgi:hypothetical protein
MFFSATSSEPMRSICEGRGRAFSSFQCSSASMSFSSIWSRLTMLRVYTVLDHRVYGIGHGLRRDVALGAGARSGGGQER